MKNVYRAITGRRYDLDGLTVAERDFLRDITEFFRQKPSWVEFTREWPVRARGSIWKGAKIPVGAPLYRICQDLAFRLGIAEGGVAPPSYRDRIADLIDERFHSRYEFCKQTGIDEGHLSRVLHDRKNFSPEALFKVLEALGVEIELVQRGDVADYGLELVTDTPLEQLAEVQRRLDRLMSLKTRAENVAAKQRARLLRGAFADELLDGLRKNVESGESFDSVLEQAIVGALREKAKLAKAVAKDAVEAEKAHRRAAS